MATPSLYIAPDMLKAGKLYSQLPPSGAGDFTVVRNTTATRVNASGLISSVAANVPRIDYTGGGCGSLLVEPAATNLLLQSQTFQTTWTAGNVTLSVNATPAPDGTTTADKIVVDATSNFHQLDQVVTLADSTTYTISAFAKKAELNWVSFACTNKANVSYIAWFNLDAGVVGTIGVGATARISLSPNGYYKCEMSYPSQTGAATTRQRIRVNSADNQFSWLGNGTDGIFLWGAQLEVGSVATSYIPTVATTQTRNADVISLSGASALIGQTSGTLYAEVNLTEWTNAKRVLAISDGTQDNRITLLINTTNRIRALVTQVGSTQADINTSTGLTNGTYKIAFAYASNDFVLYVNGTQIGTDTSGLVPACSSVYIGKLETSSTTLQLNDRITTAALYPTRLTNAELAALTTL